jgi:leucyl aminopeptidase
MRQLFEKAPSDRLKKLQWQTSSQPTGPFCYFVGTPQSFIKYSTTPDSVMVLKKRQRLSTQSNTLCDCHFLDAEKDQEILHQVRKVVGAILADAEACSQSTVTLFWNLEASGQSAWNPETLLETFAETLTLNSYMVRPSPSLNAFEIQLHLPESLTESLTAARIDAALTEGTRRGRAINQARYWGDLPANALTPHQFAQHLNDTLSAFGRVSTLTERELEKEGFGGLLAVGQGSKNHPRLVVFEKAAKKAEKTVVLIGKGITFDTGGYSIKGKQHHNEMKYDMCGAANVAAALEIIAPHLENVRLIGLMPLAENMVSADAQRPGDVYRAHNGKTVEVYNTDAEGRLILADVLSYAAQFKPDVVIDIATLTGGTAHIAGNMAGVLCTNDDSRVALLKKAARDAGEQFVHLEILEEALEDLKSDVADLTNMHNRWSSQAPTMYAAAFLREFVPENTFWVHLDIASMAWSVRSSAYLRGRGATAFGTRTLAHIVRTFCQ